MILMRYCSSFVNFYRSDDCEVEIKFEISWTHASFLPHKARRNFCHPSNKKKHFLFLHEDNENSNFTFKSCKIRFDSLLVIYHKKQKNRLVLEFHEIYKINEMKFFSYFLLFVSTCIFTQEALDLYSFSSIDHKERFYSLAYVISLAKQ